MGQTINNMREANAWQKTHEPGAPKVGDKAPDFTLRDLRGEGQVSLHGMLGDKPIGLIFGSFT